MFRIYFINHGYHASGEYNTLPEALEAARTFHFEARIERQDGTMVASWGAITGVRYY